MSDETPKYRTYDSMISPTLQAIVNNINNYNTVGGGGGGLTQQQVLDLVTPLINNSGSGLTQQQVLDLVNPLLTGFTDSNAVKTLIKGAGLFRRIINVSEQRVMVDADWQGIVMLQPDLPGIVPDVLNFFLAPPTETNYTSWTPTQGTSIYGSDVPPAGAWTFIVNASLTRDVGIALSGDVSTNFIGRKSDGSSLYMNGTVQDFQLIPLKPGASLLCVYLCTWPKLIYLQFFGDTSLAKKSEVDTLRTDSNTALGTTNTRVTALETSSATHITQTVLTDAMKWVMFREMLQIFPGETWTTNESWTHFNYFYSNSLTQYTFRVTKPSSAFTDTRTGVTDPRNGMWTLLINGGAVSTGVNVVIYSNGLDPNFGYHLIRGRNAAGGIISEDSTFVTNLPYGRVALLMYTRTNGTGGEIFYYVF